MARQVGKGFTIHLTASLRVGTKALEELCSQGRISTTNWYNLEAEPIDNHGNYSDAGRTLTFTLENVQRVEVKVITWKRMLGDVVDGGGGREWIPVHVYVEKGQKMQAFENHVNLKGYPWARQPECDKPLPGAMWRAPTPAEVVAYKAAVGGHNESAFLRVYYSDLIDWNDLNDGLRFKTGWVMETLRKVA